MGIMTHFIEDLQKNGQDDTQSKHFAAIYNFDDAQCVSLTFRVLNPYSSKFQS